METRGTRSVLHRNVGLREEVDMTISSLSDLQRTLLEIDEALNARTMNVQREVDIALQLIGGEVVAGKTPSDYSITSVKCKRQELEALKFATEVVRDYRSGRRVAKEPEQPANQ